MKFKIFSIVLACLFILTACNKPAEEAPTEPETEQTEIQAPTYSEENEATENEIADDEVNEADASSDNPEANEGQTTEVSEVETSEEPSTQAPEVEPTEEEPVKSVQAEEQETEVSDVEVQKAEKPEATKTETAKTETAKNETTKVEEPKVEEPKVEEPKVEEPKVEESKVEEPKVEEPKLEEPKVEEPKLEEPKVEEPKVEEPKVEEPKVEEPKLEEPKVEEPKVEEPKVEEPKIEEPKVEEPKVEEPKVEKPKVEEPKVEEPEVIDPEMSVPEAVEPTKPSVTPIEEVAIQTFTMPEKKQWIGYSFGSGSSKTVEQQRSEIKAAMTLAMNTETVWREETKYNPTLEKYSYIKAITYDGFEYQGKKTKIFAYVGFPEGASEDSPVPAVVLVHGGGGHPYMEWVRLWNERGYAAIAMETTGYFPSAVNVGVNESENSLFVYGLTSDFEEEGYGNAPQRSYPTTYTEVNEQWAYHGLSQVILASNILRADSRVDSDKIGITGISWGGTMVAQVIGYDTRYAFAIPVYGTAYLGDEMRSFSNFSDPYVDALWAAERNLDNAKMPILWYAYSDDNNFGVNSYVDSYKHTQGFNPKNTLVMLSSWSHSHGSVFAKNHSFWFADWATKGTNGFITFVTQPSGREVNCRINIPEDVRGAVAYVHYIESPMTYSKHNKFGWGEYVFMDQKWKTDRKWLTVDKETGTISGTIPDNVAGYYINLVYKTEKKLNDSSSIYVPLS